MNITFLRRNYLEDMGFSSATNYYYKAYQIDSLHGKWNPIEKTSCWTINL